MGVRTLAVGRRALVGTSPVWQHGCVARADDAHRVAGSVRGTARPPARARMSASSAGEQAGAGLDGLSARDFERLQRLNAAYRDRFQFPFLYAVKGSTPEQILDALERRLSRGIDEEFTEALRQVGRIA